MALDQNERLFREFSFIRRGCCMFEQQVEMERRSSFLPLVLMMCLLAGIVGLAVYIAVQVHQRTPLNAQQATPVVAATLRSADPALIHFHTGLLKPTDDETPAAPNYRLLEKAGILKLAKEAKGRVAVSLTPEGERLLASVPDVKKTKEPDGTFLYKAPLARREFVSVAGIDMTGANTATVHYNWKWSPNPLGDIFDAGGPVVKSFNLWDRQTLINKFGVDFYHGEPTRSSMGLMRNGKEWKIATL
jgi:hypothetical protein